MERDAASPLPLACAARGASPCGCPVLPLSRPPRAPARNLALHALAWPQVTEDGQYVPPPPDNQKAAYATMVYVRATIVRDSGDFLSEQWPRAALALAHAWPGARRSQGCQGGGRLRRLGLQVHTRRSLGKPATAVQRAGQTPRRQWRR